jgi:hypothetical protein
MLCTAVVEAVSIFHVACFTGAAHLSDRMLGGPVACRGGCLKRPFAAGAAKKHFEWMPFFLIWLRKIKKMVTV